MIITLTEVEYAEGAGPGLFSCQGGGVFGGCYPEVKGGSKGLCCVVYVLWVRAERRCCLCWCCEVVRVSSAADAGGRRRAASEPASQPAAHTCCVVLSTHPNPTTTRARNCALRWDARPTLMMHTHPHPPTQINPPPHTHPHPHPHPHPHQVSLRLRQPLKTSETAIEEVKTLVVGDWPEAGGRCVCMHACMHASICDACVACV